MTARAVVVAVSSSPTHSMRKHNALFILLHATGVEGSDPVRAVVVEDPDGMMVELVQVGTDRVGFVAIAVSDVARSKAFYTDVLGFHPMFDRGPIRQPGARLSGRRARYWAIVVVKPPEFDRIATDPLRSDSSG